MYVANWLVYIGAFPLFFLSSFTLVLRVLRWRLKFFGVSCVFIGSLLTWIWVCINFIK